METLFYVVLAFLILKYIFHVLDVYYFVKQFEVIHQLNDESIFCYPRMYMGVHWASLAALALADLIFVKSSLEDGEIERGVLYIYIFLLFAGCIGFALTLHIAIQIRQGLGIGLIAFENENKSSRNFIYGHSALLCYLIVFCAFQGFSLVAME